MSTILFFTSDRFAFANLSPSATTEKIILTPDPVDGTRLFIGNSTMVGYDARCNISTFDGSRATMTIDTVNNRVGIGISSPTVALDIVDAGGVRIVGPTNITGATTFTGNSRVIGTATATSFTGSAIGLTSIPAARIVGSLPSNVFASATIPVTALSGYDNGSLLLSGHLATESLNVSTISTQHGTFSSLNSGNAGIDILTVRNFSTAFGFTSTFTVGTLFVGSISSGSIGSFQTNGGTFSSISAGTAAINLFNTSLLSTGSGTASSFTVGILYAATISSGTLVSLSSALVSVSNAGNTNTANITTVSNAGVSNATNITSVSNAVITVSNAVISVSNAGTTNATNITTVSSSIIAVSNTVNYLLAVSNISALTISTSYGFFSTISTGSVFGRFIGDGSLLTNLPITSALTTVSNTASTNTVNITSVSNSVTEVSNNIITVSNTASTNTVNIASVSNTASTNTVNIASVSNSVTEVSNNLISVSNTASTNTINIASISNSVTEVSNKVNYLLAVSNISAVTMSTSFGFFSTISTGRIFGRFIGDGSLLTGIVGGGGMSYVPPVLSTTLLSTGTLTASNISVGVISTTYGFFSTISAGIIYARFVGDGSLLTNLPVTAALTTVSNTGATNTANITTVSNTVNYLLAVSNISAATMSTSFGFFSTISSGSIFARFVGDGSGLTNLPTTAALTTVSNTGATNTANITMVSNTVNYLLAVSNISAATMSTSFGFFSTISAGSIFGRFVGDGSGLTNLPTTAALTTVSNTGATNTANITTVSNTVNYLLAVSNISAATMSTSFGFFSTISAGSIFGRFVGDGSLLTGIIAGISIVPPVLSTTLLSTGILTARNISTAVISTNAGFASSFYINNLTTSTITALLGSFSSLSVSQVYISSLTVDNLTIGNDNGYINMGDVIAASLSTTIMTAANVVALNISATIISTSYGFFSTISSGRIFGRFVGDGSGLTGITSGSLSIIPPILSTTLLSTGILTASNISTAVISTNYGFFSTISSGIIYARFVGDGSLLTNLPVTTALTTVSNTGTTNTTNITTVSNTVNYLLAVSNISATTMSTSFGFFSTISSGSIFGRFVGDGSLLTNLPVTAALTTVSNTGTTNTANITTVSNSVTTVSNTVNYLLAVSNISAVSISTSFGFFSTISTGRIFGRFVGDGSLLTGIVAGISIVPPVLSTTLLSTGILTASNISVGVISTTYGFFSTISAGTIFGRFVGDGSLLTGLVGGISIVPPVLSTTLLSTGILTARNISTLGISTNTGFASSFHINRLTTSTTSALLGTFSSISAGQAYISSLTVDSLFIGNDIGFTNMGDIIATSLSTIQVTTGNLIAVNISTTTTSTNYGFFSTISAGTIYAKFVGDGSGLTGIASGGLSIIPPVLSTTFMSTGFLTARNISIGVMSTSYGFFSTISAGTVFGRFVGDGSLLTNLPVTSALTTVSNSVSTVSNTVNYLLAVSNISAVTISTSFGFFSTISAGTVFGRFVGDGSLLTNLPVTSALTTVSNSLVTTSNNLSTVSNSGATNTTNITTVSNSLVTTSNNLSTVSNSGVINATNIGIVSNSLVTTSNNLSTVSNSGVINSTNIATVSNSLVTTSNNLSTVSNSAVTNATNITTVSNSVTAVSNTVNYLLAVSNLSAVTISTSFGFFSTISAGTIFGRFVGDGSLLTGIVGSGMSYVPPVLSTTLLSTGILTARSISTIVTSTNYGFFSTISAGSIFARFVGDGSLLTGLPVGVTSILSTQAFYTSSISSANITSAQGYISSLIVDVLSFGLSNSYISMGDVIATSISTIQTYTSSLLTINLQVGNVSSLSYIAFPGLQQGYNQTIIAEQSTGTGTQELLFYKGSTTTDRIRMQTTGSIIFEPGVGARLFPAISSNVTPAMIINTSSNVGIGLAAPTTTLDVAGTGRFQILSTQQLFVSSISSGIMFGRFIGDGSGLTGIAGGGGGISIVPPVLSTTLLSTGILTAASISSATGTFSSLSAGTANLDILNTRLFSTAAGTASSFTIGSIFTSSGSVSSLRGDEARISTVTANTLSSYIVYASSVNTPNIYVTNIYANDGGIANVVASSLNASRAVFVQVIASSFQGSLIGKNVLTVETY
jgi:trimeric autotransporter adhesin